jgi:hypothetical protein
VAMVVITSLALYTDDAPVDANTFSTSTTFSALWVSRRRATRRWRAGCGAGAAAQTTPEARIGSETDIGGSHSPAMT